MAQFRFLHILALFVVICTSHFTSLVSAAEPFPWVESNLEEIRFITDARVETDYRTYLLRQAKKIKLLTFDLQADEEVGFPLFAELFRAAERGAKVQVATSKQAFLLKDRAGRTETLMSFLMSQFPDNLDFGVVGGPYMWQQGWEILDTSHIKLLIIDDEIALVSGRGQTSDNLDWLDLSFTFKGKLVTQSMAIFKEVWAHIKKESPFLDYSLEKDLPTLFSLKWFPMMTHLWATPSFNSQDKEETVIHQFMTSLSSEPKVLARERPQIKQTKQLREWAFSKPKFSDISENSVLARAIHHDFFNQMREKDLIGRFSIEERDQFLEDSILNAVIQEINDAKPESNIVIYTFAVLFPKELVSAIQTGIKERRLNVRILTNSIESYKAQAHRAFRMNVPVGYFAGLNVLDSLMQSGAKVYSLSHNRPYPYLHRKLVIIGDHIFSGSHNMTLASKLVQEELNYQFVSEQLARWLTAEFDLLLDNYATELNSEQIHKEGSGILSNFKKQICETFGLLY
jgi:phosphatidylserine/phosphatidylglycerophosphate/cardiolipin synthase-like enzyme